jgi:hypothetical protein
MIPRELPHSPGKLVSIYNGRRAGPSPLNTIRVLHNCSVALNSTQKDSKSRPLVRSLISLDGCVDQDVPIPSENTM